MTDYSMVDLLRTVSHLLVSAEFSPDAGERDAAFKQLTEIHADLTVRLTEAEAGNTPPMRRTVEIASLRAAVSTLGRELDIIRDTKARKRTG